MRSGKNWIVCASDNFDTISMPSSCRAMSPVFSLFKLYSKPLVYSVISDEKGFIIDALMQILNPTMQGRILSNHRNIYITWMHSSLKVAGAF
jgi:hypothetical protein